MIKKKMRGGNPAKRASAGRRVDVQPLLLFVTAHGGSKPSSFETSRFRHRRYLRSITYSGALPPNPRDI